MLLKGEKHMAHKSLGIVHIHIPEIVLLTELGDLDQTDITSLLSKEEKESIRLAVKGEKLIFASFEKLTDSLTRTITGIKFIPCYIQSDLGSIITLPVMDDSNALLDCIQIQYDEENDKYSLIA